MASWAPALTGQHSFFCCQMMPGTVFVQADSQHCPLWTEAESLIGLPERRIGKHVFFIFICYFFYFLLHFNVQNEDKKEELIYLWLEVRSKLRRDLDGIIAPLRITVLHVCVTFVACAGASVVHIWACHSKKQDSFYDFSTVVPFIKKFTLLHLMTVSACTDGSHWTHLKVINNLTNDKCCKTFHSIDKFPKLHMFRRVHPFCTLKQQTFAQSGPLICTSVQICQQQFIKKARRLPWA